MTCIAAIVEDGKVWMSSDSAGVAGYDLMIRRDPKIYKVGEFIFGFTSSFRMGQLLGYKFAPPEQSQKDTVERYINTAFIDSLRQTLKDGGFSNTTNGVESAGEFLVGYRGRLFRICGDYQVGELLVNFDSVGAALRMRLALCMPRLASQPQSVCL
jgi:hypothetical protein